MTLIVGSAEPADKVLRPTKQHRSSQVDQVSSMLGDTPLAFAIGRKDRLGRSTARGRVGRQTLFFDRFRFRHQRPPLSHPDLRAAGLAAAGAPAQQERKAVLYLGRGTRPGRATGANQGSLDTAKAGKLRQQCALR